MRRSTNALIAEQCSILDRDPSGPTSSKRRIRDILSDQISSLNSTGNLVLHEPVAENTTKPVKERVSNDRTAATRRVPPKVAKRAAVGKSKGENTNFIQLLTGDTVPEGGTVMSAQARLRQEIARTHVMKCLGGYKYLEGNGFDNFVVASLPRFDTNNNFKTG
ncbi:hypothetical protein BgAZ_201560 [Babesia gibsoni]|uniref:Uncharacterized protein n=1 Tax=Babesia gibsoni TaxID=33632 RepID=A0AAD8P993_BABGI|nr:hypothetical protein BgAZ_201560 [Babesia gibsoni]